MDMSDPWTASLVSGAVVAVVALGVEIVLHRMTQRAVGARIDETVAKAQADRDRLLAEIAQLRDTLTASLQPPSPEPGLFAGGVISPQEARARREEKEIERLEVENRLMVELGPVAEYIKQLFPDAWQKAIRKGPGAYRALQPFIDMARARQAATVAAAPSQVTGDW